MMTQLNLLEIKVLETAIAIILFFLLRLILNKVIERTVKKNVLQRSRGKIIKKIILFGLVTITIIFILTVWGVDQNELFIFMASVLTVIGIALFAQWSHLSNLTSGIIIFFNHSAKIDDDIIILEKDYELAGRISDIGLFFIKLKTEEGEEVVIPNNFFLQKMIKKKRN
jgi:small-conductance mechanosensitive channel